MRPQFTFYRSFWEAIRRIKKDKDRLSALEAIIAYALDDEQIDMTDVAEGIFILAKPTLDASKRKAKSGEAGGKQNGSKPEAKAKQTAREKEGENEKEGEDEKEKEDECPPPSPPHAAKPRFTPPSVEDVVAYCAERGNGIDAQQFVDFYVSKGWKVGRESMRDWKAAVRTWEKRENGLKSAKRWDFNDF